MLYIVNTFVHDWKAKTHDILGNIWIFLFWRDEKFSPTHILFCLKKESQLRLQKTANLALFNIVKILLNLILLRDAQNPVPHLQSSLAKLTISPSQYEGRVL